MAFWEAASRAAIAPGMSRAPAGRGLVLGCEYSPDRFTEPLAGREASHEPGR